MKPLLAATIEDASLLKFPLYASPKLDGVRCLLMEEGAVSRNFKPIPNHYVRSSLKDLFNLDGELIVGDPTHKDVYRNTTSGVMSEEGKPDFKFFVFDNFWDPADSFNGRLDRLHRLSSSKNKFIHIIKQVKINSLLEMESYENECLEAGYEGIMLRSPKGVYKFGRSTMREQYLMKLKRFDDEDGTIVDYEELMHNANEQKRDALGRAERSSHRANMVPMGKLGSLTIKCKQFKKQFNVGTGFTDELRQELWKKKHELIGRKITFKYQKVGVKDVPRFPVFLRFRGD